MKKVTDIRVSFFCKNKACYDLTDDVTGEVVGFYLAPEDMTDVELKMYEIMQKAVKQVNSQYRWIGMPKILEDTLVDYWCSPAVQSDWDNYGIGISLPVVAIQVTLNDGSRYVNLLGDGYTLEWTGGFWEKRWQVFAKMSVAWVRETIFHSCNVVTTDKPTAKAPDCDYAFPWWCNRFKVLWGAGFIAAGVGAAMQTEKKRRIVLGAGAAYGFYRFMRLGGFTGILSKREK